MNTDVAFLADITEHPDDDAPRLIYADWLEDRGDQTSMARAEFIRVQIRLAQLDVDVPRRSSILDGLGDGFSEQLFQNFRRKYIPSEDPLEADATALLRVREMDLFREFGSQWRPHLGAGVRCPGFRRGFVEEVTLSARVLLRRGERLFQVAPLRRVRLSAWGSLAELVESPVLARLRGIDLPAHRLSVKELQLLLSSPHLSGLQELDISSCLLRMLLGWPGLGRLTHLGLESNALNEDDVRELARCRHLTGLRTLNLANNQLGDGAAAALARSCHLGSLCALDLTGNRIGDRGAIALVSSPGLPRLRALYLSNNRVGDKGARALARLTGLGRLSCLCLDSNSIQSAGEAALRKSAASAVIHLEWPTSLPVTL
jgi:uncharacterized protein (TIGR02996 family)